MNRGMEAMNGRKVKTYRVYRAFAELMSAVAAPSTARLGSSTESIWLRSRNWDLGFLILSVALVPVPLLLYHGLGVSQTAVNLIVAGLDRRAAPVLDVHLHVPRAQLPRAPQALPARLAAAAGARDDPGLREPPGAADDLLHLGLGARAAPDHLHQRLLRGQAPGDAVGALADRRLRRDLHLPVSDGHAADPGPRLPARRPPALRAGVGRPWRRRRRADLRRLRGVRRLLRALGGQGPARVRARGS